MLGLCGGGLQVQSLDRGDVRSQGGWNLESLLPSYLHPHFLTILHEPLSLFPKAMALSSCHHLAQNIFNDFHEGESLGSLLSTFDLPKLYLCSPVDRSLHSSWSWSSLWLFLPPHCASSTPFLDFEHHHFFTCLHSQLSKSY